MTNMEHPNATAPDSVEVPRLGALQYELGFPTTETSQRLLARIHRWAGGMGSRKSSLVVGVPGMRYCLASLPGRSTVRGSRRW